MRLLALVATLFLWGAGWGAGFWGVGELFLLGGPRDEGLGGNLSTPLFMPEAVHTNPAGLGFAEGLALGSAYSLRFGVLNFSRLEAAGRYWGLGAAVLDAGPIGQGLSYVVYGVTLAAGLPLGDSLGIGLSWKGMFQSAPAEAFGWGLDSAFLVRGEDFLFGLIFENAVAWDLDYGGHREPWPWGVRGGVALTAKWDMIALILVANVRYSAASEVDYAVGVEIKGNRWDLRLGYGGMGLSCGASVGLGDLAVHWNFLFHPYLPLTVTAGASWGGGR